MAAAAGASDARAEDRDERVRDGAGGRQVEPSAGGRLEIRRRIRIEAPRDHVFETLLRVAEWWPHRLRTGSSVSLEPWVGGRFMEDWGGESGALYGFVTFIERPAALVVSRPMGMRGAAASAWTIELDEESNSPGYPGGSSSQSNGVTVVRIHHSWCGEVDAETRRAYATGWEEGLAALRDACAKTSRRDARGGRLHGLSLGYTISPPRLTNPAKPPRADDRALA